MLIFARKTDGRRTNNKDSVPYRRVFGKCSRRALYRQRKDSAGCLTWGFRFGQSLCALHVDDVPSGSPGEELEHAK